MTIVNPNAGLQPNTLWTTKEWKILLASVKISDYDETRDDDGKPRFHTEPSKCKTKWSSNLGQRQVKAGIIMLQDQEQVQQFKSLELPDSIAYLGTKLKKAKIFEDAELRADAAGTCGLAALTCTESSRAVENRRYNHTYSLFLPRLQSMFCYHAGVILFVRHDVKLSVFLLFFYFWLGFFLLGFFLLTIIPVMC
jgi:hypothetical protein